jgi:DNA topoisomerase-1
MPKDLIIVESPAKTKTLAGFLGSSYRILASMGHVRDLPKSKLGVDVEAGFEPSYTVIPERKQVLAELKKAAADSRSVYLASDPDREGEAIAWHLAEALNLKNAKRIQFNEITARAVQEALQHPREINTARVNAQQARRVLDRLVGYKISPLLWKKVQKNLSAGRVQSVAVRLIVDRERDIQAFVPEEYWSITARLTPFEREFPFDAKLIEQGGKKLELHNEAEAQVVLAALDGAEWKVRGIKKREQRRNPAAPFITSTLQQEAARKLGFSSRRTMMAAQHLYEGVNLGGEGHVGLITYMRTDSVHISQEAQAEARAFIEKQYGAEYVPKTPRQYKSKKGAQEAHEAIRPTSVLRRPDEVKAHLNADQLRLYTLIWQRFVASQMEAAVLDVTSVDIQAADYTFRATGSVVKFPGFMVLYTEGRDDAAEEDESRAPLPELTVDQLLKLLGLTPRQHFTEPPPRYSEATLVKALEERGIGRPSTYATIISTIMDRGYVELAEKRFHPTELGFVVNDQLVKHFPQILDVDFTAGVEDKLDEIAEGDREWVDVLQEFYDPFETALQTAEEQMERVRREPKVTDEVCPNCGKPMLLRSGRYGEFLGCSGYPECKTIVNPKQQELGLPCPVPGCTGQLTEKRSRRGKVFYGCNRYPECSFAAWDKPTEEKCETCGYPKGERVFRGRKLGLRCINKECPTNATNGKSEEGLPSVTEARAARGAAKTTRGKATAAKSAATKATATKAKSTAAKSTGTKSTGTKATATKGTATKTKVASSKSTTAVKNGKKPSG